jgi:hypothetical protein
MCIPDCAAVSTTRTAFDAGGSKIPFKAHCPGSDSDLCWQQRHRGVQPVFPANAGGINKPNLGVNDVIGMIGLTWFF